MANRQGGAVAAAICVLTAAMCCGAAQAQVGPPLPAVVDQLVGQVQSTAQQVVQDPLGIVPLGAVPSTGDPPGPVPQTPAVAPAAAPADPPPPTTGPTTARSATTRRPTPSRPTTRRPTTSARASQPATATRAPAIGRRAARKPRATRRRPPAAHAVTRTPASTPAPEPRRVRPPARRPSRPSRGGVARTITDVVEVIPGWVKVLLGALVALVLALGARAAVAGGRARSLKRQRTRLQGDVDLLEHALLPDVLQAQGSAASVASRAADGPAAGGDFYDAVVLPGGRGAVIVGDIAGHGRDALAQTALVRYTLRAYLQAGLEPRLALQLAGRVLDDQLVDGHFATVIVATHDPAEGTLTYASAGHPAPILAGPGAAEPLDTAFSPAIGVGLRTGLRQTTVPFAAGSVACLFTDGLVEARVAGVQLGHRGLARLVADDDAASLLRRVRAAVDEAPDDMTLCVLRGSGPRAGARVEELEVDGEALDGGRAWGFLQACGITGAEAERAIAVATAVAAEWGGAVLRVRGGVAEALPPAADLQATVLG